MSSQIFKGYRPEEYRKAGSTDLIELLPVEGGNPLFIVKWILEALVYGIVSHETIHLSGPTGSAKTSLIEALNHRQENFRFICKEMGFQEKPLSLFPIEMVIFETPGELFQRRALKDGTTYDEKSCLVQALHDASQLKDKCYPLIWLREMGRVHSSSVQGGLLDLLVKENIILPDGKLIPVQNISWIADSNYQADCCSSHTMVTLDDALKRRFTINLTLDYLPAEQEVMVMTHLLSDLKISIKDKSLIKKVVSLGSIIRGYRNEGNILSVAPPTIYGYCAFFRLSATMPHLTCQQIALATLLGNASVEDQKHIPGIFNEAFGFQIENEEELNLANHLF